jgi:hypothetical protein
MSQNIPSGIREEREWLKSSGFKRRSALKSKSTKRPQCAFR